MMHTRLLNRCRPVTLLAAIGILWITLTGCALDQALPSPDCAGDGSGLLFAQAVSGATQVPCLDPLPRGWNTASVDVNQDRAIVTFDSDRAGTAAAELRFEEACDFSAAVASPSEFIGIDRYDFIEQLEPRFRSQRHYLFPGGCVTWTFDFGPDSSGSASVAIGESLRLVSRDSLNEIVHEEFIERDL